MFSADDVCHVRSVYATCTSPRTESENDQSRRFVNNRSVRTSRARVCVCNARVYSRVVCGKKPEMTAEANLTPSGWTSFFVGPYVRTDHVVLL